MDMKVAECKEELEARDELTTGNEACLRRRLGLQGAIARVHLARGDCWMHETCERAVRT